jgi:hypothetical protein
MAPVTAASLPVETNLLPAPRLAAGTAPPLDGWTVTLGHRRKQRLCPPPPDAPATALVVASDSPQDAMRLSSAPIRADAGMRFTVAGMFRRHADCTGDITLGVALTRRVNDRTRASENFVLKEPTIPRKDGWMRAQATFNLPAGTESISVHVTGRFDGSIEIGELSLVRR